MGKWAEEKTAVPLPCSQSVLGVIKPRKPDLSICLGEGVDWIVAQIFPDASGPYRRIVSAERRIGLRAGVPAACNSAIGQSQTLRYERALSRYGQRTANMRLHPACLT